MRTCPDAVTGWRLAAVVFLGGTASMGHAAPVVGPTLAFIQEYCIDCHDSGMRKGDLSLEGADPADAGANAQLWEKVVEKLHHRQMPPLGEPRPDHESYERVVAQLTHAIDRTAAAAPDPGRTDTFRRLSRTEYQNAIRDLLALDIDATDLLPNEEPGHGFDNVMLGTLSPTLIDRYVSAAQKIARLAIGAPGRAPGGDTFRIKPDFTQEHHVDGLPLGTRGGALIPYTFPRDGVYEFQLRLARDRNEHVEGLKRAHEIEVLIDRERVAHATVKPATDKDMDSVDAHLKFRVPVIAGPHDVGVTFVKTPSLLIETEREPFIARYNMHRHPRTAPALYQVSITGPFDASGPGDSPSRRRIFAPLAALPAESLGEDRKAELVLATLLRRAYRRPVSAGDLRRPMEFFREGSAEGAGFDAGIENALSAILVSPQFLLRIETDPPDAGPGTVYAVSDLELASRLSFFLWSSLPDDALLDAAVRGELRNPKRLEAQVRRMLADARARSLVTNFASQWLHLRKLDSVTPDLRLFPNFDDNLRQSFREETERFVESIFAEDRSVTELLAADYTFLNERLAKHYGIPHIYGSHFRRVSFADDPARQRGGLLRHGSILTVTSYATRTSPVIRGSWVLANLVGAAPPPPPPNIPSLEDNTVSASLPMRARLSAHRTNKSCASCHDVIDPIGFSLENFDAVGRWRTTEEHQPIDVSGSLPDGTAFVGVTELERALLQRPEVFAGALTAKLLVFALGRGVEYHDAPAIRQIVARARSDDFRFSSLILGIVNSTPFQMRKSP